MRNKNDVQFCAVFLKILERLFDKNLPAIQIIPNFFGNYISSQNGQLLNPFENVFYRL